MTSSELNAWRKQWGLSQKKLTRLLAHCPTHLKPIFKLAYYSGMRQGEILNLVWDRVDLSKAHECRAFIKLKPEDTKTKEGRLVPLNQEMIEMFQAMPRGLPTVKVFAYLGKSLEAVRRSFETACKRAGIEDFTFHDLRHTFINNRRVEGHDYFRIMAATGHKTMSVFKRYNTVSRDELQALVNEKSG